MLDIRGLIIDGEAIGFSGGATGVFAAKSRTDCTKPTLPWPSKRTRDKVLDVGGTSAVDSGWLEGRVTFGRYVDGLLETPEGEIVAANVLDGTRAGLHGVGLARELLEDAYRASGEILGLGHAEFFRRVEAVALGRIQGSREYLKRWEDEPPLQGGSGGFTVIWRSTVLNRLPSPADFRRFSQLTGMMRAPGQPWLESIRGLPPEERYFVPARRATLGQAFVWFTDRMDFTAEVERRTREGHTPADASRDVLGLIHRQPTDGLVALHLPSSLIRRRMSARPSFVEANSHSRFSVLLDGMPSSADGFGRTVDLAPLAAGDGLRSGLKERVTLSIDPHEFRPGERVEFEVLGRLSLARGQSPLDDTPAFASLLVNGRTRVELVSALN